MLQRNGILEWLTAAVMASCTAVFIKDFVPVLMLTCVLYLVIRGDRQSAPSPVLAGPLAEPAIPAIPLCPVCLREGRPSLITHLHHYFDRDVYRCNNGHSWSEPGIAPSPAEELTDASQS